MSASHPRFDALRQKADPRVVNELERLVFSGRDEDLSRINVLDFAKRTGIPEEAAIDTFVHAAKLGLFDLSWNLLCPGCGGVLDELSSLKSLRKEEYGCTLCATGYKPTLDEMVEVSFTVNPAVRRITAHNPENIPLSRYYRDVYFSKSLILPSSDQEWDALWKKFTLECEEVPPREKIIISLQLPEQFVILFEPVLHGATFIDAKGPAVKERRDLTVVFSEAGASTTKLEMSPGPLRITIENRTDRRILPGLFIAGAEFHHLFETRQPFLTAKRLFTNQTFRDTYRADTLDLDQRLKIASLTVLFTDLKSSTELYEQVGDLVAYDLVREHFRVLGDAVRSQSGAVVKTIGDAVMATFPSPDRGLAAALMMRDSIDELNASRGSQDLLVKIGLHEGPCLAVISNDRLDYFGQTVNIAARVQALATSRPIFATEPIVRDRGVMDILGSRQLTPEPHRQLLRGIADELTIYEIP